MTTKALQASKAKKRDKRRYVKLTHKGGLGACTATPAEAEAMLAEDPDLEGSDVWMP